MNVFIFLRVDYNNFAKDKVGTENLYRDFASSRGFEPLASSFGGKRSIRAELRGLAFAPNRIGASEEQVVTSDCTCPSEAQM